MLTHIKNALSFAGWTNIFTLFLLLTAIYSIVEDRNVNKTNNRAYMTVSEIRGTPITTTTTNEETKIYRITVNLKNSGNTPAMDVSSAMTYESLMDDEIDSRLNEIEENGIKGLRKTIAVYAKDASESFLINIPFGDKKSTELSTPPKYNHLIGVIKYRDVHGDKHVTKVCFTHRENAFIRCTSNNSMM